MKDHVEQERDRREHQACWLRQQGGPGSTRRRKVERWVKSFVWETKEDRVLGQRGRETGHGRKGQEEGQ